MEQPSDAPNTHPEPMDLDPVHPLAAFDLLSETVPCLSAPPTALPQYVSEEVTPPCLSTSEALCSEMPQEIPTDTPLEPIPTPSNVPTESSEPSAESQEPAKPPPKSRKSKANAEDDQGEAFRTGQRHPEPSLDDPSRAFYESLLQQNPKSEMAIKYCLEHGLVPENMIDEMMTALTKIKRDAKKKTGV